MILKETLLSVIDFSGVKITKTFNLYGGFSRKKSSVGYFVKGSVRLTKKKPKNPFIKKKFFRKGNIARSVIFRQRYLIKRIDGSSISFNDNSSAILKKKNVLRSSFLVGPSVLEIKNKKFILLFKSNL